MRFGRRPKRAVLERIFGDRAHELHFSDDPTLASLDCVGRAFALAVGRVPEKAAGLAVDLAPEASRALGRHLAAQAGDRGVAVFFALVARAEGAHDASERGPSSLARSAGAWRGWTSSFERAILWCCRTSRPRGERTSSSHCSPLRARAHCPSCPSCSRTWRAPVQEPAWSLACAASLAGHLDDAVTWLEACARFGYGHLPHIFADDDLRPLAGRPDFEALRRAHGG